MVVVERKVRHRFGKLVVGYHCNFIGRAEAGGDGREALLNLRGLPLIEIVVDKNDGRKRYRLGGELANLLFDSIREDSEVILLKIPHQLTVVIFYCYRNDDGVCWNDDAWRILLLRRSSLRWSTGRRRPLSLWPGLAGKAKQEERT